MKTTSKFTKQFDGTTSLDGREYIEAELRPGLTVRAYAELDDGEDPHSFDDGEFTADEIASWERDEWHFATVTLTVHFDSRRIATLACYGGIVHREEDGGRALNEAADELLVNYEREAVRKVKEFAKAAAKAAK
jgi:hypothetical protein